MTLAEDIETGWIAREGEINAVPATSNNRTAFCEVIGDAIEPRIGALETAPTVAGVELVASVVAVAGVVTVDFDIAPDIFLTLDGDYELVLSAPSVPSGRVMRVMLHLEQGSGGGHLVTDWSGCVFYNGGDPPELSTEAGYVDSLAFVCRAADGALRGWITTGAPL